MYFKPKVNFKRMSVEVLDQAAENVFIKMDGNDLFADAAEEATNCYVEGLQDVGSGLYMLP